MGLLDSQTTQPGLLSSGTPGSQAQKWANALAVMSAGLKDAGAWLQHDPAAAGNVAALARQRAGLQPANGVPSAIAALPPNVLAALLLHAAQQKAAVGPNVTTPDTTGGQTGATRPAQMPLQTAPAPMLQPTAPQQPNQMPTAQTLPAQNPGWGVQKVR